MDLRGLFGNPEDGKVFKAGTTIFTEGTPGDVMYVVLDGEVEVSVGGKVIEVMKPGDLFGEMALIDFSPRSATALAKSDCRLAAIDEKRFVETVYETPFFAVHVMRVLASRLRSMNANLNA